MKDYTLDILTDLKKEQLDTIDACTNHLKFSPKGSLKIRKINDRVVVCSVVPFGKYKYIEKVISGDADQIAAYINKALYGEKKKNAQHNLAIIDKAIEKYRDNSTEQLWAALPEKIHTARSFVNLKGEKSCNCINSQMNKQDDNHTHPTNCGIWVRSKNEQYICDKLDSKNIKFEYEPLYLINGEYIYPDFVIHLPNGRIIIWEHLGMIDKLGYCTHNAKKLNAYYLDGYMPGKNLFFTYNFQDGSIDLQEIERIINEIILPYYR